MRYSLHLTTECNLRCTYCYENKERELGAFKASHEDIDRALSLIPNGSSLELLGGEPFLVMDLLQYATDKALAEGIDDLMITTNGTIQNDKVLEYIERYKPHLVVSLDPPRSVEKFRRGIHAEAVLDHIEQWLPMTKLTVNMTIHPGNVSEMETAFSIYHRLYNVKSFHFGVAEELFGRQPDLWNSYVEQGRKIIGSLTREELSIVDLQPWSSILYFDKEYVEKEGHEVLEIYHPAGERELTNFEKARTILHEELLLRLEKMGLAKSLSPKMTIVQR